MHSQGSGNAIRQKKTFSWQLKYKYSYLQSQDPKMQSDQWQKGAQTIVLHSPLTGTPCSFWNTVAYILGP